MIQVSSWCACLSSPIHLPVISYSKCYMLLSINIEKPIKSTFSRKSFSDGEFVLSNFNAISI